MMNQEELKKVLPHRDNMLLVEEAELEEELPPEEEDDLSFDLNASFEPEDDADSTQPFTL